MKVGATIVATLVASFFLGAVGKTEQTSFNFSSFRPLPDSISFDRDGSVLGDSLELNPNRNYTYGRATYSAPVHLWDNKTGNVASFSTRFSFSVFRDPNAPGYADGFVFFLSPVGYVVSKHSRGSGFTIFDEYENASAVAVEFDTFQHDIDSSVPHVGIDVGSAVSKRALPWNPFGPRSNFTAEAEVTYNPADKTLSASFVQETGSSKVLSYSFDLREALPEQVTIGFAGTTGRYFERHVIHSWSFSSSFELAADAQNSTNVSNTLPTVRNAPDPTLLRSSTSARKSSVAVIVGGLAGAVALAIAGAVLAWFIVRRRALWAKYGGRNDGGIDEKELDEEKGPKSFSYSELERATNNFAPEDKLGRGGFGFVYKGFLRSPAMAVAIKRVARDSQQGRKEFSAEVKIISRLRHRNLVKLVGWCLGRGELLLVYEFMTNRSLDAHLYSDGNPLSWPTRYNIAKGVAAALLYLHEQLEQCVVHRDVKPSNVMLDANFNAKLGDFGLARLVDHGSSLKTTAVAGTMGYLAPETALTGTGNTRLDVYSFGVLALEITCGRRPILPFQMDGELNLVEWVWDLYEKGSILQAADPKLCGELDNGEAERLLVVGLWCAHPRYQDRPSMSQVMGVLHFNVPIPNLPTHLPSAS